MKGMSPLMRTVFSVRYDRQRYRLPRLGGDRGNHYPPPRCCLRPGVEQIILESMGALDRDHRSVSCPVPDHRGGPLIHETLRLLQAVGVHFFPARLVTDRV
jgi:hypothetical protein